MSWRAAFSVPRLRTSGTRLLWTTIALGTLARLVVAFATRGVGFDIDSYEIVRTTIERDPLHLYALVNVPNAPHWPYPPGFLPWLLVSDAAARLTGLRFDGFVQIAPIAADAALAWLVQASLGQRGAAARTRLLAAALVAFGPSFAAISGYHGQIDAVLAVPIVLGFWLWTRPEVPHRAIAAGLLIGLGGSIKVSGLVFVLALLPSARSVREAATLVVSAAAVPLLLFAPFLLADAHGTVAGVGENKGLPGFGGISLLVQPDLSALWLHTKAGISLSSTSQSLFRHSATIAVLAWLATGVFMLWRRPDPLRAALLVWITFYAFGVNFALQYLVWGMPFFLMAGYLREVLVLQALLLVPTLLIYGVGPRDQPLHHVYTPILLLVWAAFVAAYVLLVRDVVERPRRARPVSFGASA